MSMPIGFASKVSLFSMRRRAIRTGLSLLPCVLLIAVMFIGSTIPNGLVNELDKKVLSTVESRQEIVVLDPFLFQSFGGSKGGTGQFNPEAYAVATTGPEVADVYPQYGQVSGVSPLIGNVPKASLYFAGSNDKFTQLYSDKKFVYELGKPIPVLLNPGTIGSQTYVWGDSSTLEIDYAKPKELESKSVYKQLDKAEDLIGKTFTMSFGDFPNYPEAFEEQKQSGFSPPKSKLTKLTDSDREILDRRVNEIYSPYWNVDALRQPIQYEFQVIGLIKGQNISTQGFIPNEAVVSITSSIYERQALARTAKPLTNDFIGGEQIKTEFKDGFISNISNAYPQTTWQKDPSVSAWQVPISSVGVSGLLYEAVTNAKGESTYAELPRRSIDAGVFRSESAVVRLNSAAEREGYIKRLADSNIQIFDASPLSTVKSIRSGSNIAVTWLTIILGTIVAFILLITMSRFVADSRREIGVWRAIGATRFDIIKLVLIRMLWLIIIGVGVGIAIGFGISVLLSQSIANSVNSATTSFNPYGGGGGSFIGQIVISLLGGIVPTIDQKALLATNWGLLGSRLAMLALISIIVGLIPALRAARISPITAIRDSE